MRARVLAMLGKSCWRQAWRIHRKPRLSPLPQTSIAWHASHLEPVQSPRSPVAGFDRAASQPSKTEFLARELGRMLKLPLAARP
eukprot:scaffold26628_cov33-Tisochrysis_lutea.AAC.4